MYIKSSSLISEDSWDQCDDKELEVNNKEVGEENNEKEQSDSNIYKKNTPLLGPMKKRSQPAAEEKLPVKCDIKHCCFSLPLSSDKETEEESDCSSYAPTKPYHTISSQSTLPHSTDLREHTSDNSEMKLGGQLKCSQTSEIAVIYEQQCWKEEIINKRDMKQGRRRPLKQYLVQWEHLWVGRDHLTTPQLLQNWKEKKTSKHRHQVKSNP